MLLASTSFSGRQGVKREVEGQQGVKREVEGPQGAKGEEDSGYMMNLCYSENSQSVKFE